ncbi:MAG TPA: DUF5677 domain-containing protein [Gaiellaceae bacterium]|nr:DUF5677 domain-containing protein [Gaiellaceae bacterium]
MLTDELAAADAIIDLVRNNLPPGLGRGDTGEAIMYGTYPRALRRFIHIRDLAREGAGDEAMILARSLLSMVARAIWIDVPPDAGERRTRFERWKKRELEDELKEAHGLEAAGFPVEIDYDDYEATLAKLEGVAAMPNDRDLLASLKLVPYYERIYRAGSKHMHFTLHHAMDELLAAAAASEDLPLERPDPELSSEVVTVAILTYAMFLEAAEGTVKHGLTHRVAQILADSPAFPDFPRPIQRA